ncbi:hypothetical protein ILUMI_26525 [Ignelater luminosus]|uniref:Uncharacterized protein n=1 Tax=Ignelater luminosus TaxID=2038154 RepID=A0A8K0C6D2_IGNLU|nr:hypothetical protein ILUMI_26525 [Ignelater luminosus]
MDNHHDFNLVGGLTLTDVLGMLEENEDDNKHSINIAIMPPINTCEILMDEDSGDENDIDINNLPAFQLRAEVELFEENDN